MRFSTVYFPSSAPATTKVYAYRAACVWCFIYATAWALASFSLDPAVPYDAIEALNRAVNNEWGSPKNPWMIGTFFKPLYSLHSASLSAFYWYASHFFVTGIGMLGCYCLAYKLTDSRPLAWLAMLTLNLSTVINVDVIPYNDNFLLFGSWPWIGLLFIKAVYDSPKWWVLLGVLLGLATMLKYASICLVGMIFFFALIVPSVRRCWQSPYFYIGVVCFLALVLPNVFWLIDHNFAAVKWVGSEMSPHLSMENWLPFLSVFYPLLFVAALLGRKMGHLTWHVPEKVYLSVGILLAPLAVIMGWFSFHQGDRLTEWLQSFFMSAPAVLVGFLSKDVGRHLRRPFNTLMAFALILISGYILVMSLNIKNAGKHFSGIKTFSDEAITFWELNTEKPLTLVGGAQLAQWLTFYIGSHPQVTNKWSEEAQDSIYNPHISAQAIERQGVLVLGKLGEGCQKGAFSDFTNEWKGFKPTVQEEVTFQPSPNKTAQRVCLGIVSPN